MTHGDRSSVKCPACRLTITNPLDIGGVVPCTGQTTECKVPCPHCKRELHMWARVAVVVDCERESKVA